MRSSTTAIVARNEAWSGAAATEPYEAGWAEEAVFFLRALKPPTHGPAVARVEISPDGMRWVDEGTTMPMPGEVDAVAVARVRHFGNWLRLAVDLGPEGGTTVLVTLHLKG